MYFDGPLFRIQCEDLQKSGTRSQHVLGVTCRSSTVLITLARRQSQTRFYPLDQSALAVANGSADFCIGRPVAPHSRLGQPRWADAKKIGRILSGQQALIAGGGLGGGNVLLRHGGDPSES